MDRAENGTGAELAIRFPPDLVEAIARRTAELVAEGAADADRAAEVPSRQWGAWRWRTARKTA